MFGQTENMTQLPGHRRSFRARQHRQSLHRYPKSEGPAAIHLPDPLSGDKTPPKGEVPQRTTDSPTSGTEATMPKHWPIKQAQTPKRGKFIELLPLSHTLQVATER